MLHSIIFGFLGLATIYLLCLALAFAASGILLTLGWPFRKDSYADLQDLDRPRAFVIGSVLFLVLIGLWLLFRYPLLLVGLILLSLLGLAALLRFLGKPPSR